MTCQCHGRASTSFRDGMWCDQDALNMGAGPGPHLATGVQLAHWRCYVDFIHGRVPGLLHSSSQSVLNTCHKWSSAIDERLLAPYTCVSDFCHVGMSQCAIMDYRCSANAPRVRVGVPIVDSTTTLWLLGRSNACQLYASASDVISDNIACDFGWHWARCWHVVCYFESLRAFDRIDHL